MELQGQKLFVYNILTILLGYLLRRNQMQADDVRKSKNLENIFNISQIEVAKDSVLAGGLITSPAWAPLLSTVNELLVTATLVIGLIIGIARLWILLAQNARQQQHDDEE